MYTVNYLCNWTDDKLKTYQMWSDVSVTFRSLINIIELMYLILLVCKVYFQHFTTNICLFMHIHDIHNVIHIKYVILIWKIYMIFWWKFALHNEHRKTCQRDFIIIIIIISTYGFSYRLWSHFITNRRVMTNNFVWRDKLF